MEKANKQLGRHSSQAPASVRDIGRRIFEVRNQQVMLDEELANLYAVETRALLQQVRRNQDRFPEDFAFQLSGEEFEALRSQSVMSNTGRGGRRYPPYVFTEEGVAMLSGVLRSEVAVAVNIEIMRAFVELRRMAESHAALAHRMDELEREVMARLGDQEEKVAAIFKVLREVTISKRRARPAGFVAPRKENRA